MRRRRRRILVTAVDEGEGEETGAERPEQRQHRGRRKEEGRIDKGRHY